MEREFSHKLRSFRELGGAPALADRIERRIETDAAAFAECATASPCHNDLHEGNLSLYRIYHTLDLWVWYQQIGPHQHQRVSPSSLNG